MNIKSSLPDQITKGIKSGDILAGDSFPTRKLEEWYEQEKEAFYESEGTVSENDLWYTYMRYTNRILVFNLVSKKYPMDDGAILFLGTGSGIEADEFYQSHPLWKFTFLESSSSYKSILHAKFIKSVVIEAAIEGHINVDDNSQDIICAFHVLHHIANVTLVMSELHRVVKHGGLVIIREPCSSMGDWRFQRSATPNERGISKKYMLKAASSIGFKCYKQPIPVVLEPINKFLRKINMLERIPFRVVYIIDRILSLLFSINDQYWRDTWYKKIGPSSYLYVFQKK